MTLVDNVHNPTRVFGTTQFLGVGTIERDPSDATETESEHDDDEDCGGVCMVQGGRFIGVPLAKYFPKPASFPFFVQPYALNTQHPSQLVFWANGVGARPSGFHRFDIPANVTDTEQIGPPVASSSSCGGGGSTQIIPGPAELSGVSPCTAVTTPLTVPPLRPSTCWPMA